MSEKDLIKEEHLCGWGPFHPKWLQRFHNATCLMVSLMCPLIIHGIMIAGFVPASVTQWSKKFGFKNQEIATINSSFDVAAIFGLIIISHYGNLGHKGRFLGIGIMIYAFGTLLSCLPQWMSDPYEFAGSGNISSVNSKKSQSRYCITNSENTCDNRENEVSFSSLEKKTQDVFAYYIFLIGSILRGLGSSPLFVLGTTYLDENVSQERSPKLLGFMMFGSGIGPLFGAVSAAMCLKIYGDIDKNIDLKQVLEQIGPDDPRWYGAWWIGFLLVGVLGFFFAIPILGFARKLPRAAEEKKEDISQEFKTRRGSESAKNLKEIPKALLNLLHNYCFLFLIAGQTCSLMVFAGMMLFGPRLVENLFNTNSSNSLLIAGLTGLIPASLGMALSGFLISRLKLRCKALFRYCALCLLLCVPLMSIVLLRCQPVSLAGIVSKKL